MHETNTVCKLNKQIGFLFDTFLQSTKQLSILPPLALVPSRDDVVVECW